jgi:hypothetical protein
MTVDVRRFLPLLLLALVRAPVAAEAQAADTSARVDWTAGRIVLETVTPMASFADPRARYLAARETGTTIPSQFLRFAPVVVADSWDTVGTLADRSETLVASLAEMARAGSLDDWRMSPDLRGVLASWTYPLYGEKGLVAQMLTHKVAAPLPRSLGAPAETPFTGLVIYAAEPLPSRGTRESRLARPAVFPRIYDDDMKLVLEKEMLDPAVLVRWGMVACTADTAGPAERVGTNPLRLLARGVFGHNDTDLLIPREAAHRLLSNEANRRLLREGRIAVVYSGTTTTLVPAN